MYYVMFDEDKQLFALYDRERQVNSLIGYFMPGNTHELEQMMQFQIDHDVMPPGDRDLILDHIARGKRIIPADWRDLRSIAEERVKRSVRTDHLAALPAWVESTCNIAQLVGLIGLFTLGCVLEPVERRLTPWRRFAREFI